MKIKVILRVNSDSSLDSMKEKNEWVDSKQGDMLNISNTSLPALYQPCTITLQGQYGSGCRWAGMPTHVGLTFLNIK